MSAAIVLVAVTPAMKTVPAVVIPVVPVVAIAALAAVVEIVEIPEETVAGIVESDKFMKKQYIYLAIGLAVFALVVIYFFIPRENAVDVFNKEYKEALKSLYAEKNNEVFSKIEKLIGSAPTPEAEAKAKILTAFASNDNSKSISLFKEVAGDSTYPSFLRADAAAAMADFFMLGSHGSSTLASQIFSSEPYVSFAITKSGRKNYSLGARKLYEYASSIYVIPWAEYRIAEWYLKNAILSKLYKIKTVDTDENYTTKAEAHILKGDLALEKYNREGGIKLYSGYANWIKGFDQAMLWELKGQEVNRNEAETMFKAALNDLDDGKFGKFAIGQKIWANFQYSSFVARTYGVNRKDDILKLNSYVTTDSHRYVDEEKKLLYGLHKYMFRLGSIAVTNIQERYDYESAKVIARVDPNFRDYLRQLGWKDEVFK